MIVWNIKRCQRFMNCLSKKLFQRNRWLPICLNVCVYGVELKNTRLIYIEFWVGESLLLAEFIGKWTKLTSVYDFIFWDLRNVESIVSCYGLARALSTSLLYRSAISQNACKALILPDFFREEFNDAIFPASGANELERPSFCSFQTNYQNAFLSALVQFLYNWTSC